MKKNILYAVIILSIIAIVRWLVLLWKKTTTASSLSSSGQKYSAILNPTTLRNDVRGSGAYNAIRIGHLHEGIDIECKEGQAVYAPFDGEITRLAYPYAGDTRWRGLVLEGNNGITLKLFYVSLTKNVGDTVLSGQQIAVAQAISKKYGVGMKNHVHIELLKNDQHIDPTPYFL